jgi:type VII secretion-associated serine protease mycosin
MGATAAPAVAADSVRAQEWHLDAMHASEMWKTSTGKGITVAVVDTGVKASHPDLVGQVLPGKDFSDMPGGATTDVKSHGTHMAGIIAGTGKGLGGEGDVGLAPGSRILPLRVGEIDNTRFLGQLSAAIRYAADSDAKIINISWGAAAKNSELTSALSYAFAKGKLVVAAVGNEGQTSNLPMYPAAIPGVVGVSGVDRNTHVTSESQHGPQVALAAPGVDIVGACTAPSGYCKTRGTSDATALVSASAALVWSKHPDWNGNQVLRVLINTASKPSDGAARNDYIGYGVVRPRIALTNPGDPGPADVSPLPAAATPASPSTSATTGGEPTSGASQAPTPPATPAPTTPDVESKDGNVGLWIGVGIGVLVVVAVVVIVLVRRGRRGSQPPYVGPGGGQPPYGGVPGQGGGSPYAQQYPNVPPAPPYQGPHNGNFGPPQQ